MRTYVRNNIIATHRLLEATKNVSSLKCFVNVSTSSVYGAHATDSEEAPPKPTSYYGVTKLAAEQLALAYHRQGHLPACSLRLFSVYGPRERPEKLYHKLIHCILEDIPFPLYKNSRHHSRSFTFIDDAIEGLAAVLADPEQTKGEIFNIGSDTEVTTGEGIDMIEAIIGREARKEVKAERPGDQLKTCANIDKARRMLGYEPKTDLKEGLKAEMDWYKEKVWGKGLY